MDVLTLGVLALLVVVYTTTVAPKIGIASPLVLVILGIAVSFLPATPVIHIEPEWILGGVLPPLLYSAAVKTPTMEFRRDLSTISIFAVLLVVASAVAVGFLLVGLIPDLPLGVGIAVGAVVSPTDAVATAIVRRSGASSRIVTVLEGEALLNDATALVLMRAAIAAVAAGFSFWRISAEFLYALGVAIVIGYVVGKINVAVRSRIPDAAANVAFSLTVPFLAAVPAEHLGASGLVAAVVAGLVTGQRTPRKLSARIRIAEDSVWQTVNLILESAIFMLMGLQLRTLLVDMSDSYGTGWMALGLGALVTTVIIVIRSIFVFGSVELLEKRNERRAEQRERLTRIAERMDQMEPSDFPGRDGVPVDENRWTRMQDMFTRRRADLDYLADQQFGTKDGVVLVAAGMRGAVTLAAAQSLPLNTPDRSLLILIAFVVAAGTLIVQGGSLTFLVKWLKFPVVDASSQAVQMQQLGDELRDSALAELDRGGWVKPDGEPYDEKMVQRARTVLTTVDKSSRTEPEMAEYQTLHLQIIEAQRDALLKIRDLGTYPSELLSQKLAQLDADQISTEARE